MATPAPARPPGPAAGELPVLIDPRRWGSLIGLVGGMVLIASFTRPSPEARPH